MVYFISPYNGSSASHIGEDDMDGLILCTFFASGETAELSLVPVSAIL